MFTKTEYEVIAGVIRSLPVNYITKDKVVKQFANRLELTEPNFDREKFFKACYTKDGETSENIQNHQVLCTKREQPEEAEQNG